MAITLPSWGKIFCSGMLCGLVLAFAIPAIASEQDSVGIINGFIAKIPDYKQLNDEQSIELTKLVTELRDDDYARSAAITEGLAVVYPEFAKALEKLGNDELAEARSILSTLADSEDSYLAAESTFYLARTAMFNQEFETAIPLLQRVLNDHADKTVQLGNALYFIGIAQANMLENQQAIESLTKFVDDYPSAPERMRISAIRQVQLLTSIEAGSMMDVYQRMNFSHTRLIKKDTGERTKTEQDKIIDMLSKMIKEAEKQECSSCKSSKDGDCDKPGEKEGQGEGQGKGQSQQGGGSNNPDGVVRRSFDDGPASAWSKLRERDRDAAFNSIKEKFPARYQGMVEKYFKSFQTEQAN
jgi:tetratricopeptide (TPR) repeat protein